MPAHARKRSLVRKRLIRAREFIGLRRTEFARLIGVSKGYVGSVEDGLRDPSFSLMQRWVKALGPAASADLFDPAEDDPPQWRSTAEMLCLSGQG